MFDDDGSIGVFDEIVSPPVTRARPRVAALIVEDDPDTAHLCSAQLAELGVGARVVWVGDQALEALAAPGEPLTFIYVDLSLRDGSGARVAAEARRLHPGSTLVTASREISDVLLATGIVLCKPFTAEQFASAFDAALLEGPDGWRAWVGEPLPELEFSA